VRKPLIVLALFVCLLSGATAYATAGGEATDTVVNVLIALVVILVAAKIGGDATTRLRQPAVLGELVAGVILGNLVLLGLGWFEPIKHDSVIRALAELGVIILLFQVGLESNLADMMSVGLSSLLVATAGVIVPFFLGWGVGIWFYPQHSIYMHVFLGATLTATSVGITARVLRDLGRLATNEARIILGAAVIDDVMGLLILAIVAGIIRAADTGQAMSSGAILWLVAKAVLFLGGAVVLGRVLYPILFRAAGYLRGHGMLLVAALASCFVSAVLAAKVGLAPIVGAFAAGLVLDEVQYRDLPTLASHRLEELLEPIATVLVPVFFVLMGMHVDLATFGQGAVLGFAAILTLAAILGKQASAFGVVRAQGKVNRWIVGLGMIPRGEVGLIFASIGLGLTVHGERVVFPEVYSAVVIMIIVTTLVTPPALTWAFRRPSATAPPA